MTTATPPAATRRRAALRRWVPQSAHYRELLRHWRDHCATVGVVGDYCRCGYCNRPNRDGHASSAYLHWDCYQRLLPYDAREAREEAASLNGAAHAEPKGLALLTAAARLAQPVNMTRLVLAAWRERPDLFGLPGSTLASASDSRVRTALYGKRGLISRGYVAVEADGYVVTPAGRALAGITNGGPHP
jgi:hypothetical protein